MFDFLTNFIIEIWLWQFIKVGANVKTKCVAITKSKKGNGSVRSYKDLEFWKMIFVIFCFQSVR